MTTNNINTSFTAITGTGKPAGGRAELAQLQAKLKDLFVKVKELRLRDDLSDDYKKQMLQLYQAQIELIMKQIEALQTKPDGLPSAPDLHVTSTEKKGGESSGMTGEIDTFA